MESNLTLAPIKNNIIMAKEQYLTKVENAMDSLQVFFYSVIFVLGILGNGLVIWITGFKMAKTVNSIWFLNLAVADFLFSATRCVPLVKNAFFVYWPFGEFLCRANSFLKYLNMFSSIFLLAAISLDRCMFVILPVWSKNNRQPRLAWVVSAISWGCAVVASIPFYIFRGLALDSENRTKCSVTLSIELSKDKEYNKQAIYFHRFITGFLIPFLVILTCYLIIALKLKQRSLGKSRKPFHVILAIVITFFICWTPYHVFLLLKLWGIKGLAMSIGSPLSSSLAYLNSCINPVLYFFMGLNFKMKLNQSLLSVFKRSLLDDLAMSGYSTRRRGETSTNNHLDEWTVTGS
ncbi:chemerin-like receptor 1 [Ambystoma mexicanum]|uniref:chemerin-like receptor 1 n=1 Tax=Ambystoma mexicanum TaxID=8296 RepID=UPI0037E825E1